MAKRGRPAAPLLDRQTVVEAALQIIDRDGLAAMSMRKLGAELNVTGPSLYYHFANKEDLLDEVGRLVMRENKVPKMRPVDWREAIIQGALRFYGALTSHPNASPLLISRRARTFAPNFWEYTVSLVIEGGVDPQLVMPLLEGIEALAVGEAVFAQDSGNDVEAFGRDVLVASPALGKAVAADTLAPDERFEAMVRSYVNGWPTSATG